MRSQVLLLVWGGLRGWESDVPVRVLGGRLHGRDGRVPFPAAGAVGVGLVRAAPDRIGRVLGTRAVTAGADSEVPRWGLQLGRRGSASSPSAVHGLVCGHDEGSAPAALAREVRLSDKRRLLRRLRTMMRDLGEVEQLTLTPLEITSFSCDYRTRARVCVRVS